MPVFASINLKQCTRPLPNSGSHQSLMIINQKKIGKEDTYQTTREEFFFL